MRVIGFVVITVLFSFPTFASPNCGEGTANCVTISTADAQTLYNNMFGKQPGPYVTSQIVAMSRVYGGADLQAAIANLPSSRDFLANYYKQQTGVAADDKTLGNLQGALGASGQLSTISGMLGDARKAGVDSEYQKVLGHSDATDPNAGAVIGSGKSLTDIGKDLAGTAEGQAAVTSTFQNVFGRAPTADEISQWTGVLAGGDLATLQAAMQAFHDGPGNMPTSGNLGLCANNRFNCLQACQQGPAAQLNTCNTACEQQAETACNQTGSAAGSLASASSSSPASTSSSGSGFTFTLDPAGSLSASASGTGSGSTVSGSGSNSIASALGSTASTGTTASTNSTGTATGTASTLTSANRGTASTTAATTTTAATGTGTESTGTGTGGGFSAAGPTSAGPTVSAHR